MKKCKECKCNKDGKCLLSYVYLVRNRRETTLTGWEIPLELEIIKQAINDGDAVKSVQKVLFMGVWQPMKTEDLQFLPEGQRSWDWYWIHAKSGTLNLQTQDKIIFNGRRYKVMKIKDYSLNGFIEYNVILDFEDNDAN